MLGALYSLCPKDRALTNLPNTIQSDDDKVYGWLCRQSGKEKFTAKDIAEMKKTAELKAADRNRTRGIWIFMNIRTAADMKDDLQSAEFAC